LYLEDHPRVPPWGRICCVIEPSPSMLWLQVRVTGEKL
jgi:hypothetical protein